MRTAMALLAALALVVVAGWVIDDVLLGNDIPRNVTADGVDIGGHDKDDARDALGTPSVLSREVTLIWAGDSITRTAEELGVEVDIDETIDRAADRGTAFARPFRWLGSLVATREIDPVATLAPDALRPLFSTGDDAVFEIQRDAPVIELIDGSFVSSDPGSVPVPDLVGLAASLLEALDSDADPAVVDVPTLDEQIALDGPDVIAEVNELTAGGLSVSLVGDNEIHEIPEAAVRSWVVLDATDGDARISLDDDAVLDTLRALFVGVGDTGEQAEFLVDYVGGIHIVGGVPGSVCCEPDTADRLLAAMRNGDEVVEVWPQEDPDAKGVAWAESLGITELVGQFTTNFVPGQSRVRNIERISELTQGAVIEPGETFSINDYVGRRTTENGFVAAGVITNGVFSESVGGGISQYATTLFNAAFFAGLDFGEYQSHSIYISRYPYGREATVSFGAPDLEIVNTTPHGVLVWPTTTADSITVQLYSTRTVSGEQTGQTERREGTSCTRVTTERTRTWTDGRTELDTVTARYRPEGINCNGSSTVPTTTTTAPPPTSITSSTTTTTTTAPTSSTTTTTSSTTTTTAAPPRPCPMARSDVTMASMTGDDRMSDIDALIWAIEHDPRLRSTITAVAVFDGPLDRRALRHRIDRATRVIPRLRHHVVTDPLDLAPPRWEHDDDFCLAYHLRLASLGGDGTRRDLYDLTEELSAQPFDRSRPPWEITHVEGLADGQSALIIKSHHAISDGIGGVELSLEIFDLTPEAEPDREELPPVPPIPPATDPLQSALRHEARATLASARGALATLLEVGADPIAAAHRVGELLGSANRQLRPPGSPMSTTMRSRSVDLSFDAFSVPLEDLRRAGRRVDGTINDAFVAAVVLGTSAYHRRHGDSLPFLRLAIPVNRRDDPSALGNHWSPGRLELELGPDDPDTVLAHVRDHMRRLRAEPAHDLLDPLASVLRRLPNRISSLVASSLSTSIDVAASNVPGSPVPLFLQGRSVTELTPFGPLSGAATNVTLLSHGDQARIGVNRDPAAVTDGEAFTADLHEAFERVARGTRP